ncbi:MAG: FAD-dependent oxidoreductase [Aquabacterium sp.]|nr:FAD-dependent oxidoreductase [Ferruginibacter sp.]
MINYLTHIVILILSIGAINTQAQQSLQTQVLVIGGGTGGTAAGIQSARLGANTIIAEPTTWLGGMISAAGVSATDGNHQLPSGLWREFRDKIYLVYGGPKNVATGWVSNTQFEPHVADSIFKAMAAAEKKLTVLYQWHFAKALKKGNIITGAIFTNNKNEKLQINANLVIDATELGDVMADASIPYSLGMEAGNITGENVGITTSSNVVQDLTYVAVLKDYGPAADCTIVKPAGYQPMEFDGACTNYYIGKNADAPNVDAKKMLDYGKLPHNKYMLNWPKKGNDTYLEVVEMTEAERNSALQKAKQTTLRFVYFIQQQLGFKNLGLADDEFPSADRLALMPYHREGRRVKGLVRFTINDIAQPFAGKPLYRTGISVGDYPIDHHHKKNPAAPQHLEFYPVPSYNIPLGALIPEKTDGIIIAEKGISVSNVANGSTRLQPCVMLTGQAAGVLAALAILQKKQPRSVAVRAVQNTLLKAGAYLMPYMDVPFDNPHFAAIQKIGATGILKGTGVPYKWANQTWFYPDSAVLSTVFKNDIEAYTGIPFSSKNREVTIGDIVVCINSYRQKYKLPVLSKESILKSGAAIKLENLNVARPAKRFEIAVLVNEYIKPFDNIAIDHEGNVLTSKTN